MRGLEKVVGQTEIISRLRALKDFYVGKDTAPGHILLVGPEGMGKRTIAMAFAEEMGSNVRLTFGRSLERKGDLTAILTALERHEFLVIEEIGRLRQPLQELLVRALEDFRIDLVIGQGLGSRIHPFKLNPFTCVGTCSRESDCSPSLKGSFFLRVQLERYSLAELGQIAERIAVSRHLTVLSQITRDVARASEGSPQQVDMLMRQLARAGSGEITVEDAKQALAALGLSTGGFDVGSPRPNPHDLSGVEFEQFIAQLLRTMGFQSQLTKATGDGGIDIVAILERPIIGGRYLFQCKRLAPDSLVGAAIVREFYGALTADRRATKGILVATSGFTEQAKQFAQEVGIELIDGAQLASLVAAYGADEDPRSPDLPVTDA